MAGLDPLDEDEFARQEIERGRKLHRHDGIWWATVAGSYSRPAFEFRQVVPRKARPARLRSLFGYSHQVPDPAQATRWVEFMMIQEAELRAFGMSTLRSEKRARVRKGLRECEIREVADFDREYADIKAVNISQAARQMSTGRFDRPPSYFTEREAEWRTSVRMCFGRTGWRWIGAYFGGKLIAYVSLLAVENHAFVMAVKSHSDFLGHCPNDALYFTLLSDLRDAAWCRRVSNGGPEHESLNRFKRLFGFRAVPIPYYSPWAGLVQVAKRTHSVMDCLRRAATRAFLERGGGGSDDTGARGPLKPSGGDERD